MTTRRNYTARDRARAVGLATVKGSKKAAAELGIPRRTLDYWLHSPEFAEFRHRAKEAFGEEMWGGIQIGFRAVMAGFEDPDVPFKDKANAFGTLYDRFALLTGAATARTETFDIGRLNDHERAILSDVIDRELNGRIEHPDAAPGEPGAGEGDGVPAVQE